MLRQSQQLKLLQKISPQQIQFIKLLQIPTATLEARIKEELEANPALEEGLRSDAEDAKTREEDFSNDGQDDADSDNREDEFNLEDYLQSDDSYKTRVQQSGADDDDYEIPVVALKSFYENLREQLGMLELTEEQEQLAEHLIGSIDEDGYLRRELRAISNDLAFRQNIRATPEELETILLQIQKFDPAGIAARDLRECLLLQLERKEQTEDVAYATRILKDYFKEFSKKHFSKLRSALGISEEKLKDAYGIITRLNPKPGGSQTHVKHEYIIPDFILSVENGEIDIKLNRRNAPDLRVNGSYIKMFREYDAQQKQNKKDKSVRETLDFVKSKIDSAKWFIDALRQRQFTLLNTMYSIADKQKEFFLSGGDEKKLRPMILKDIAEEIQMDISTVSRVANSKYVETEFGIFPLKYFFTEGITTADGSEVSNREVKSILEDLINNENKKKPLSDDKLSALLKEKGYNIARRTVAKYREQLNLPVARLRKEV